MVDKIFEVRVVRDDGYSIALQWADYSKDTGDSAEVGYRFVWFNPDGTQQVNRGQTRLPSIELIEVLLAKARMNGWAQNRAHDAGRFS